MGRRDLSSEAWKRELEAQRIRQQARDPKVHAAEERTRYWRKRYGTDPPPLRPREPRAPRSPRRPLPEIPRSPAGHPIYLEALAALRGYERGELAGDFDSIGRDLLQTYALAVLEGSDPAVAIEAERRRYRTDRLHLIHGTGIVDDLHR